MMKTWKDLNEAIRTAYYGNSISSVQNLSNVSENMSPCALLSLPSPPTMDGYYISLGQLTALRKLARQEGNKDLQRFLDHIHAWIGGYAGSPERNIEERDRAASVIADIVRNCPTIKGWARFHGKVYRGLKRSPNDHHLFRFKKVERHAVRGIMSATAIEWWAVGEYTYETKSLGQSWSRNPTTAQSFTGTSFMIDRPDPRFPALLEYMIKTNESLSLVHLANRSEAEVIRLSKSPIVCKCYIPLTTGNPNMPTLLSHAIWKYSLLDKDRREILGSQDIVDFRRQEWESRVP